jgi:Tetraacyldisaccharide-1-P 4''-kinase
MELSAFWFGLYKLLKYLVYPYTWLFLLLGILVLLVFWPQPARRLGRIRLVVLTSFAVAYLLGSPLIATQLIGPLEEQYPAFDATTRQHFGAIVVLGGGCMKKAPCDRAMPSTSIRLLAQCAASNSLLKESPIVSSCPQAIRRFLALGRRNP